MIGESAGLIHAALLPYGPVMAKVLGTLGAASLGSVVFQTPERATLFYATDDASINAEVEQLIRERV